MELSKILTKAEKIVREDGAMIRGLSHPRVYSE